MDVDLTQYRVAGVNESMRGVRRNDNNAAGVHLALFISDRDSGAAFDGEGGFDVRMRVQWWALPGLSFDEVGRERRSLSFADELIRRSDKWQLLEIDEAHGGNLHRWE